MIKCVKQIMRNFNSNKHLPFIQHNVINIVSKYREISLNLVKCTQSSICYTRMTIYVMDTLSTFNDLNNIIFISILYFIEK